MRTQKCYLYTRVSTSMQVDGFSLDAQRDKLRKYAAYQDMAIAGEYSEAGVIIGLNTAKPLRHIGLRCFGSILQLFRENLPARTLQEAGWAFQNKEIGFVMQFDVKVILI